jgi:hypothetical protein
MVLFDCLAARDNKCEEIMEWDCGRFDDLGKSSQSEGGVPADEQRSFECSAGRAGRAGKGRPGQARLGLGYGFHEFGQFLPFMLQM